MIERFVSKLPRLLVDCRGASSCNFAKSGNSFTTIGASCLDLENPGLKPDASDFFTGNLMPTVPGIYYV